MNAKLDTIIKDVPVWVPLTLLFAALLLISIVPKLRSPYFIPNNQLAYFSTIDGDVKVSDGISDVAAQKGALISKGARTVLKTGKGTASLKMPDGSSVILDSESMIEFNRQSANGEGKAFTFNLVSGRILVINGQDSRAPTQVLVGGFFTAKIFQAALGLTVPTDEDMLLRVDCLAGPCLVNGTLHLETRQNASIDLDGTVHVATGVPYDSWISLGKVGSFIPILSNLFMNMRFTNTPSVTDTFLPSEVATVIPNTPSVTSLPSPSSTLTFILTVTPTGTLTRTPWRPSPTLDRYDDPTRIPSNTANPTLTSTQRPTPIPIATITPTRIPTATSVPTVVVTNTAQPTITTAPTSVPTVIPTNTPQPTRTRRPTRTDPPPDTPVPTDIPPTDTPVPPTDIPPTDTPVPPTDVPPTDVPPTDIPPTDVPPTDVPPDTPVPMDIAITLRLFPSQSRLESQLGSNCQSFPSLSHKKGKPLPASLICLFEI